MVFGIVDSTATVHLQHAITNDYDLDNLPQFCGWHVVIVPKQLYAYTP